MRCVISPRLPRFLWRIRTSKFCWCFFFFCTNNSSYVCGFWVDHIKKKHCMSKSSMPASCTFDEPNKNSFPTASKDRQNDQITPGKQSSESCCLHTHTCTQNFTNSVVCCMHACICVFCGLFANALPWQPFHITFSKARGRHKTVSRRGGMSGIRHAITFSSTYTHRI